MDAVPSVTPAESSVAALTEMPLRKPRQGSFFKTDQAEDSGHACQEGNEHPPRRQDPEGRVQWAGTGIAESCRWLIDVRSSEAVGLVLQWDAVDLRRSAEAAAEDDMVVVYGGLEPLPTNTLARVQGSLDKLSSTWWPTGTLAPDHSPPGHASLSATRLAPLTHCPRKSATAPLDATTVLRPTSCPRLCDVTW